MKASFVSKRPERVPIQTISLNCNDVEAAYANLSWFGLAGELIEY